MIVEREHAKAALRREHGAVVATRLCSLSEPSYRAGAAIDLGQPWKALVAARQLQLPSGFNLPSRPGALYADAARSSTRLILPASRGLRKGNGTAISALSFG